MTQCQHSFHGGRCDQPSLPTANYCRTHRGYIPNDRVPGSVGFDKRQGHESSCRAALSGWQERCTC